MQEKNTIKGQIDALNDQIDDISAQIVEKEQQITDKQAEIDQKQAEYDDRWAKYKEQVVSMQMLDQGGGIALLSTAENIYQLLTFDQVLQDISDANTQACEDLEQQGIELTNERTQLEEAKASLEADEEELQNQKSQLDSKTQELASNIQAQDASISAAAAQEQALEEAKSDKQAEFDKAADEYDAYLKSLIAQTQRNYANAPISCSLNFICPLPSYKYISCQYGSGGHKGVDFAAPGGTGADLSLKDLSLIPYIRTLHEAGVLSFKIEGRMKRPEYVAAAVTACRQALENGKPEGALSRQLQAVFLAPASPMATTPGSEAAPCLAPGAERMYRQRLLCSRSFLIFMKKNGR